MEPPERNGRPIPLRRTGFLARFSFWWVWPLISQGSTGVKLHPKDIYQNDPREHTSCLWKKLDREWTKELNKEKDANKDVSKENDTIKTTSTTNLAWALARSYGMDYAWIAIPLITEDILANLGKPILFKYLIEHFSHDSDVTWEQAFLCAVAVALVTIISGYIKPSLYFWHIMAKIQWKGGLLSLLYRKATRLSNKALHSTTTGHIIDVITVDGDYIDIMVWHLHTLWRAPFHILVVVLFIYNDVGSAVYWVLALLLTVLPVQLILAKIVSGYRSEVSTITDERVTVMGEIISAVRVIKMYCWEKPFGKLVDQTRRKELAFLHKIRLCANLIGKLSQFASRMVMAVIIIVHLALYGPLSAAQVFPMFSLIQLVSDTVLNDLALGFNNWYDVGVSMRRVHDFLMMEEKEASPGWTSEAKVSSKTSTGVTANDVVAQWDDSSPRKTLWNVSFNVRQGELLMVVGRVGAGKSSLLMSLLGELPIESGTIHCVGKLTYAAQQPWLFSSNVRRNILFGAAFDRNRYNAVIEACSLTKDLELLQHGDKTLVGEKGITLSGGQKARVSLARALYSKADVYLLDDPLSAVDSAVSRHIFDKCINGYLKNKARILVTHQLQFLSRADKILVLHEGRVQFYGTYEGILKSGIDLAEMMAEEDEEDQAQENMKPRHFSTQRSVEDGLDDINEGVPLQQQLSEDPKIANEENISLAPNWQILLDYFRAGNNWSGLVFVGLVFVLDQATAKFRDWFLSKWTNVHSNETVTNDTSPLCDPNDTISQSHTVWTMPDMTSPRPRASLDTSSFFDDTLTCAAIYVSSVVAMLVFSQVTVHMFFKMAGRCSVALHDMMYQSVSRAPCRFFDTTPKGRILNHFSGDLQAIDSGLPNILHNFLKHMTSALGNIIFVSIMCPNVLLVTLPVCVAVVILRHYYVLTQRHCKRLVSESRVRMLSHLNATMEGMETIRAFHAESRCRRDFDEHHNAYMSTWLTETSAFCWYITTTNLIGSLYCSFTVFSLFMRETALEPGEVGIILQYLGSMAYMMGELARISAEVEIRTVKAGRVVRYTRIPPEAALESPMPLPPIWPSHGNINFRNVCFRYDQNKPLVLKDLTFGIKAGEKVGIVGRTGAGKSSLVQALFRMAEPSGEILIDGKAINQLGLHDLRSKLSIIPQDPVLFRGSVKRNLDPFGDCTTSSIWWALEEVQLKAAVESLPNGLESKVYEGGSNFSVGQRQLFCLARALLRKNKVLVLDEATANVDKHTDDMIQNTIREKFIDCTVLTIAHRLNTVMDSDRILVMEDGKVAQFDEPTTLLENPDGLFYKMVEQTGAGEQRRLTSLAQEARDRRSWVKGSKELRLKFQNES